MPTRKPESAPPKTAPTLSVRDLKVGFQGESGFHHAVGGVSFELLPGEVLGIVGESGSGKSVTSLALMRLIPEPPGKITHGEILFQGQDLLKLPHAEMRKIRGSQIAMIFQEPMTALNPVFTVGMQVMETVLTHQKISKAEARDRAVEMLEKVGIPDARRRLTDYPHQFSGGMRQRVMIALALICHPQILIADEPTTALDVTTQAQILDLMLALQETRPGASVILITHNLGVVAETCDRVLVMYGGRIQELGTAEQIFSDPQHPYTRGLLKSLPQLGGAKQKRLYAIPGNVPSLANMPAGCRFCTRCEAAREHNILDKCIAVEPPLYQLGGGHEVRCHLLENR